MVFAVSQLEGDHGGVGIFAAIVVAGADADANGIVPVGGREADAIGCDVADGVDHEARIGVDVDQE